jgi:calcium homeostasis ER protein
MIVVLCHFLSSQPMTIRSSTSSTVSSSSIDNKAVQMMTKMGWHGKGLGVDEQGIETPIDGGIVRDTIDQYRGVGAPMDDPFDQFRKARSSVFQQRYMRGGTGK